MRKAIPSSRVGQPESMLDPVARAQELRQLLRAKVILTVTTGATKLLEDEVLHLCGAAFSRKGRENLYRGGSAPGVMLWEGQQIPIKRPRVRGAGREVPLTSYQDLRSLEGVSEEITRLLLCGISSRDYGPAMARISEAASISKSQVSEAFGYATRKHLDQINGRDLSAYRFVVLFFDGIAFAGTVVVVGLGITDTGEKVVLGLREGASENAEVCGDLISSLKERGLQVPSRILVVIDGAKALAKAVRSAWGSRALIARCRLHKARNVLEYLPESYQAEARRRMNAAWNMNEYSEAKAELAKVVQWLSGINESAAESLKEAFEETLVMHRLRLPEILRKSLATTNVIESAFSIVRERTRRVKNWRSGRDQVTRWAAAGLLVAEKRIRRIRGYKFLPLLVEALTKLDPEKEVA